MLSYEVQRIKPEHEPWALFLNLVSRDYGEVISKTMQQHPGTTAPTNSTADGSSKTLGVTFQTHNSTQEFSDQPEQRVENSKINRDRRNRQGLVAFKPTPASNSSELTANIVEEVSSFERWWCYR